MASAERFAQGRAVFSQALLQLKQALEQPENSFLRDSVIQRFEFTFELGWKAMQQGLALAGVEAGYPKAVLQEALSAGLIADGNGWSALHEQRNLTSHTYDEAMAKKVYAYVKEHAVALFDALEQSLDAFNP